jgi:hypothetical protein
MRRADFEFALYFNEMPFMWRQNPQAPFQRTTFFSGYLCGVFSLVRAHFGAALQ